MATQAAILSVLVEANTRSATTSLNKFDAQLKRVDKTTATATTRTTGLGTATKSTGTHLANAARYAAGAAAAYLSIAQAKAAITTTQDLAKTTAGLNRNLGLSVKTASEWGAVAKSRDVDAKSLTMSFTTLSRRLVDTSAAIKEGGSAADTAFAPFKRLGLSQQEVVAGSKDLGSFLPVLADAFGDAAGGAERQASAQQLLGRGYQSILPLFASGAKGLKEQQMWADKYGATLNDKTLKAQMDLVQAERESKVAVLGLQVSFAQFLTPALEKANSVFQRIAKIVGSDKLTQTEKFEKLGAIIGKWADKAYDAFVKILPKIVSEAGQRAPAIAAAFVQGFLNADIWGKLAVGTWLFAKLGGRTGFLAVGKRIGVALGAPIATTVATEAAAGATAGKAGAGWSLFATRIGQFAGPIAAVAFLAAYKDDILAAIGQEAGDEIWQSPINNAKGAFDNDKLLKFRAGIDYLKEGVDDLGKSFDGLGKHSGAFVKDFDHDGDQTRRNLDSLTGAFKDNSRESTRSLDDVQSKGNDFEGSLRGSFKGVGQGISSLAGATFDGLQNIGGNVSEMMDKLKVGKISFSLKKVGKSLQGFQRGGHINVGAASGDSVPAMLERDEYVLNRNAVKRIGKDNLDAINFGSAKRFQKGGSVGGMSAMLALANKYEHQSFPYLWGGGHAGFVNAGSPVDCSGFVSDVLHAGGLLDGAPMVSGALMNWGKPASGNEPLVVYANPEHTLMKLNGKYAGTSGTNPGGGAGWIEGGLSAGYLSAFAKRTMDVGAGVAREIKRVLLKGPDGPLKDLGQKSLDTVRNAANKYVSAAFPSGMGGGGNNALPGTSGTYTASWYGPTPATTGAAGVNLIGTNSFAELSNPPGSLNFSALGGLPYHKKIGVTYKNKTIQPEKLDVGAGGPGLNGHVRAIDLWQDAAKMLPGFMSAGIADVEVSGLARGGQPGRDGKPFDFTGHAPYIGGFDVKGSHIGPELRKVLKFNADLKKQMATITALEESIDVFDRLANADDNFTPSEMQGELRMYQALYGNLLGASDTARRGLGATKKPLMLAKGREKEKLKGIAGTFSSTLEDLTGVTGHSGRLLNTYLSMVSLGRQLHESTTASQPALSVAGLMEFAQAIRYGVMDSALPKAHNGGFFDAPPSAEMPVMIRGQEAIVPMDGGNEGGGEWAITIDNWEEGTGRIRRLAQGEIANRDRNSLNRQRMGAGV